MEQKEATIPVSIKIAYSTEEEKKDKIQAISSLLREIWNGDNKISDLNNLKKVTQILKNRMDKKTFGIYLFFSFVLLFLIFNTTIGLGFENGHIKTNLYLWQGHAQGYYISNEKIQYGELGIEGCNKNACVSDKWIVIKRLIDYYYQ